MSLPPLVGQQIEAFARIKVFLDAPIVDKPYFVTHGLAGAGKTRLLIEVALHYPGILCAYTGKAATVIERKSGLDAMTIHSAIYAYKGTYVDDKGAKQLAFGQRIKDDSWDGRIIFVDECSMIPESMALDLLATGARLVVMGDPGQLPPVKGAQYFHTPDFTLTEVHRQAWDSPIIRQAHAVRAGYIYQPDGPDFNVTEYITEDDVKSADIMLCFKNDTRRALNTYRRAHNRLAGLPQPGEPIMCLKNARDLGIMNGGIYTLDDFRMSGSDVVVDLINDAGRRVNVYGGWFEDVNETTKANENAIGFAWAYAATVHKSQGSEFDHVILIDEYPRHWADRPRWVYTGITRASKRITIQPRI